MDTHLNSKAFYVDYEIIKDGIGQDLSLHALKGYFLLVMRTGIGQGLSLHALKGYFLFVMRTSLQSICVDEQITKD